MILYFLLLEIQRYIQLIIFIVDGSIPSHFRMGYTVNGHRDTSARF